MKLLPLLILAVASLALGARPADACSPPRCWSGFLTPANGVTVPANLPAIHWAPMTSYDGTLADPSNVTLETVEGDAIALTPTLQADGSYLLAPATPLVAGTTYVLTEASTCDGDPSGPRSTFVATAAAPLPTTLGTLTATPHDVGPLEVATNSGSCSSTIDADTADVVLALAAEAAPWGDVLHYETRVGGQRWSPDPALNRRTPPGVSWVGRAVDRVYTKCAAADEGAANGLAEGTHTITMHATLPGTSTALAAAAVTVELACSAPDPDPDPDTDNDGRDDIDNGGCSTGGSPAAGGLALGLAALLGRRRVRR